MDNPELISLVIFVLKDIQSLYTLSTTGKAFVEGLFSLSLNLCETLGTHLDIKCLIDIEILILR